MVVCARLDEREWWKTLRLHGVEAERRFELGTKIPLAGACSSKSGDGALEYS